MSKIKTHKFRLGKYRFQWGAIEACCDTPGDDCKLQIHAPEVTDFHTFCLLMHEADHADGLPDSVIHDKDGFPVYGGRYRLAWRVAKELFAS